MTVLEKVGIVLLALMLIPLIAITGPAGLGAVLGAVGMVYMMRVVVPRR